jgi:peptidoglycan/LPS O-acetylase OafA/YrhL
MSTSAKPTRSGNRVPELDALRFAAALAVMGFHYFSWARISSPFEFGWLGVQLFFMISGFVIFWSALGRTAGEFLASRASRLFPSYWVCLTITASIMIWVGATLPARQIVGNFLMLSQMFHVENIDPVYWTLYIEQKFYAFVLVLLLLRQSTRAQRWLEGWLAVAVLDCRVPGLSWLTMDHNAAFFISGALFFFVRRDGLGARRGLLLLVSMLVGMYSASRPEILENFGVPGGAFVSASTILALHVIFLAMALGKIRLPGTSAWYVIGSLTYPLYLIHARSTEVIWSALSESPWIRIPVVAACSLSVAAAIAYVTERRACGRLQRLLFSLPLIGRPAAAPQGVPDAAPSAVATKL